MELPSTRTDTVAPGSPRPAITAVPRGSTRTTSKLGGAMTATSSPALAEVCDGLASPLRAGSSDGTRVRTNTVATPAANVPRAAAMMIDRVADIRASFRASPETQLMKRIFHREASPDRVMTQHNM